MMHNASPSQMVAIAGRHGRDSRLLVLQGWQLSGLALPDEPCLACPLQHALELHFCVHSNGLFMV